MLDQSPLQQRLVTLGLVLGALLVLAGVGLVVGQRSVLFPYRGEGGPAVPEGVTLLEVAYDGGTVPAVRWPADAPSAVWFHGSGESIDNQIRWSFQFSDRGLGFAAIEYPGFGGAQGADVSEASVLASARAGLDALAADGMPVPVCIGASFGTGVAVAMAAEGRCAAVVLASPYTSMAAVVHGKLPGLGFFVFDRFDSLALADQVTVPALVLHGREDSWVSVAQGEQLAAALPEAELVVRDLGHLDLFDADTWTRLLDFVALHGTAPKETGVVAAAPASEASDSGGAVDGDPLQAASPVAAGVQAAALAP